MRKWGEGRRIRDREKRITWHGSIIGDRKRGDEKV